MNKIVFILGGIKSGKSYFAVEQAKLLSKKYNFSVTYLATCVPRDNEMKKRVVEHKNSRPSTWVTIEEPINLTKTIEKIKSKILIIDCLNIWLSNVLEKKWKEEKIIKYIKNFFTVLKNKNIMCFIISNEVGSSMVSTNKIGRVFQNILGKINQIVAKNSNRVYLLTAGIPLKLK